MFRKRKPSSNVTRIFGIFGLRSESQARLDPEGLRIEVRTSGYRKRIRVRKLTTRQARAQELTMTLDALGAVYANGGIVEDCLKYVHERYKTLSRKRG